MTSDWLHQPIAPPDPQHIAAAMARQDSLTKPPGALGQLEQVAIRLCALQGRTRPSLERVHIAVFAADHGVAADGVSAFPQAVTVEMVRNFARGGAAINVLARHIGARLEVVNVGTLTDPGALPGVFDRRVAAGSANMRHTRAMNDTHLTTALAAGSEAAGRARASDAQLFIGGEMGIGNTTAASAVACALLDLPATALAGPGTGLDAEGVSRKTAIIAESLARHPEAGGDALTALRCVGGLEIAALAGAYIRCAQIGLPVLVDGFITSVAALAALRLRPDVGDWMFFAHHSAEPGHRTVLAACNARPLLHLDMRLGEGSGAAAAVPLMRLAVALHNEMATFAEAQVSGGDA
jgi:nicotinate-nucleotide--dimethylbenzimidazole phosphoribosyltransferase